MEVVIRKYVFIIFFLIFLLGIFLRVYRLGEIPNGLYQDETAIGYNAYSILLTGKDEYGKSFPLYFKSFGDYKLPVYVYLTTIPVKIFGLENNTPRVVSSFFSILSVGLMFFFVKRLTKNNSLALVSMFLISINPWHLHYGRATFEVSVGLALFLLGGWLLLSKNLKLFSSILAIVCFLLALYTYNLTRLLAPLVLLLFIYYRWDEIKEKAKSYKLIMVSVFLIGLIPFLITFLDPEGLSSAKGTLLYSSSAIQAQLLEIRSYMLYTPEIFQKLFFSTYPQTIWEYLKHILSYFSAEFFFISGSTHGNHGIGNFGLFYPIEIVTIITGIIVALKSKKKWSYLLLVWVAIVVLVASLTREAPHATRSFFLIVPVLIFSANGVLEAIRIINKRPIRQKLIVGFGVFTLFVYGFVYYFASYYERFPVTYAQKWNSEDKKVVDFIKRNESNYEKIVIDTANANLIYTSILYYQKYDPAEFQRTVMRSKDDSEGFSKVESFGKYEFRKIDWNRDKNLSNTLFITSEKNIPEEMKVIEKLTYPQRPVVVNIGQEIYQFPVTDSAYVLLEKN